MKIAIIGSGISGLYAAWRLSGQHEITIFEKNNYYGGHTDTHQVDVDGQQLAVDRVLLCLMSIITRYFAACCAHLMCLCKPVI